MIEKLNNRDAERQAAIRMHLLRVFAFMDAAAGDGLHFPEHELDAGEILSDLMAEVNVEPEDHEDVAQALVDECAPEIPTPAADEVEAVARAIQDAHAPGHPINHVSIYQARAAIAALQARSAVPAGSAWIVSNGNGDRWRTWNRGWSEWTAMRDHATRYARRVDAEAVHAEDEDAWRVEQYGAEPAGEEPVDREDIARILFDQRQTPHDFDDAEDAEPESDAGTLRSICFDDADAVLRHLRPATPTNPERRERGAEPTDAETAAAARRALGTWLSWPDAARDGVPAVDNGKVCSWLQGVPSRLAALSAPSNPERLVDRKFSPGERVTKHKGSSWTGHVVGFYSTALTPIGYAVESETETGSVQIYPEAALSAAGES